MMPVGRRVPMGRLLRISFCLLVLNLPISFIAGNANGHLSFQVGAWGDDASVGSLGVHVEIRTNAYDIENSHVSPPRLDYFWVGSNLGNGAFIQFGYVLEPGYYCLNGFWKHGEFTCTGGSDMITNGDARWEWQYWPASNRTDFYYEKGPADSAGSNGTWHSYSIVPSSNGGWSFSFDGKVIASINSEQSPSARPIAVVAEQVTTVTLARLGPVEFRNASFLRTDGWHQVSSLTALVGCAVNTPCTLPNPYGIVVLGPNDFVAGSGLQKHKDGELLWPQTSTPFEWFSFLAGPIVALELVILFALYLLIRHRRRTKSG